MYTYTWYQWLAFFYVYCFLGWIFESTYVSLKQKRLVNRGFLRLPMLPLYGSGAVMMLWVSLPVRDSLTLVYISGFIAATALEYVTGAVMERLFKVRYWDYSSQPFQLHGYICLSSSIAWGFLTILMTDVIHDPIARTVLAVPPVILAHLRFRHQRSFHRRCLRIHQGSPGSGSYAGSYDEAQSRYRRAPVQDRAAA